VTGEPRFKTELTVEDLVVARGGRPVVAGASFRLKAGETLLLKGPNGAGKTSLLRALAGLLPARGAMRVAPAASRGAQALREAAIYVGHLDGVKAAMTGAEHLRFWSRLHAGGPQRIDEASRAFDLGGFVGARAGAMSAGQRRRLGLARLILSGKPIWLLDEPTAAMDAASAERLVATVAAHNAQGGAAIVATHEKFALSARALHVSAPA
jgi:heme exporter protein A